MEVIMNEQIQFFSPKEETRKSLIEHLIDSNGNEEELFVNTGCHCGGGSSCASCTSVSLKKSHINEDTLLINLIKD